MYHEAALLKESLDGLNINPNGIYVDVTFGGGGHAKAIVEKLDQGKLYAFDQDDDARKNLWEDSRLVFIAANFKHLQKFLRLHGIKKVDGILADLGVSSHQFNEATRGFSLRFNAKLDMRMNVNQEKSALTIVNEYGVEELSALFKMYGELRNGYRIAKTIDAWRAEQPFETTEDLNNCLKPIMPQFKWHKFLAQVYQALRIEVNDELSVLKDFLTQSADLLNPGGRLVVISYHSLEDRLVKNFIRDGKFSGEADTDFFGNRLTPLKAITRKPLTPSAEEVESNRRSSSAKLRVAEKK